jgi:hypothetical protein
MEKCPFQVKILQKDKNHLGGLIQMDKMLYEDKPFHIHGCPPLSAKFGLQEIQQNPGEPVD